MVKKPFWIVSTVILIYLASIYFINPFGEYAVNDDWNFITHVRNFRQLDFVKNSLVDSSFILQGVIGAIWSFIFGLSFNSLRVLTIVVTVLLLCVSYKIINYLKTPAWSMLPVLLTLVFNPFVYLSSMTFMTEVYFLFFIVCATYYFLKYYSDSLRRSLVIAFSLGGLSILIRQLGLLFCLGLLIATVYSDISKKRKLVVKNYLLAVFIVIIFGIVCFLWPQYNSDNQVPYESIILSAQSLLHFRDILRNAFYFLPYLGVSLLPLSFIIWYKLKWFIKPLPVIFACLLIKPFFAVDIFMLGNVLYPESLMSLSNTIFHFTLFNNSLFKLVLCFLVLFSLFSALVYIVDNFRISFRGLPLLFLILSLAQILPIFGYVGLFDRYFVNGIIFFVLYLTSVLSESDVNSTTPKHKVTILLYLPLILFIFYVFGLTQDFIVTTKTQWVEAAYLKSSKKVDIGIFLSTTFTKYTSVFDKGNGPEITRAMPSGINYRCYVQKVVYEDKTNALGNNLRKFERRRDIRDNYPNVPPIGAKTYPGFRPPTEDQAKIVQKVQIYPILETLVGNKVYVESYCEW